MQKLIAMFGFVLVTLFAASVRAEAARPDGGADPAPATSSGPATASTPPTKEECERAWPCVPPTAPPAADTKPAPPKSKTTKVVTDKAVDSKGGSNAAADATATSGDATVTLDKQAIHVEVKPVFYMGKGPDEEGEATAEQRTAESGNGGSGLRLSRVGFGVGLGFHCNSWDRGPGCGGLGLASIELGFRTGKKLEIVLRPFFGWEVEKERRNPYVYGGDVVLLYGPSPPKDGWAFQFGGGVGTNRFLDRAPEPTDGPSAARGWDAHVVPELRFVSQELFVGLSGTLGIGETNWQEGGEGSIRYVSDVSGGAVLRFGGHLSFF